MPVHLCCLGPILKTCFGDCTYGSRLAGVASVIKDRTGGVISELAENTNIKSPFHTSSGKATSRL